MKFSPTKLDGLYIVDLQPMTDNRGWFARTYCKNEFESIGHKGEWVQMNHSFTAKKGAIRGLHFQKSPYKEIKMVRCIAGAVLDVVVDLRKDSKTFLKWTSVELTKENMKMIYIPEGFAHGFQTLANDSELIYHHTEFYTPGFEGGIRHNDPKLKIEWPLPVSDISDRDLGHVLLSEDFKGI